MAEVINQELENEEEFKNENEPGIEEENTITEDNTPTEQNQINNQEQFFDNVIKMSAISILEGKINCNISRQDMPKNFSPLVMNTESVSWSISIMIEILNILMEEGIFSEKETCNITEEYMELFNKTFITWRIWKDRVNTFINRNFLNNKFKKRISKDQNLINVDNLVVWIRYSVININALRAKVINTYFMQPTE